MHVELGEAAARHQGKIWIRGQGAGRLVCDSRGLWTRHMGEGWAAR